MTATPTLDRALAVAAARGDDPLAAAYRAVADLEGRWFALGDRRLLPEIAATERALGLR